MFFCLKFGWNLESWWAEISVTQGSHDDVFLSSSSSSVSSLSSLGLPALSGPLLTVSRPPSGLPPLQYASSDHPLVDSAAGASSVGEDVVLEDGEVGRVGVESERAAAEGERRCPAANSEGSSGSGQSADGLSQLDRRLPAETQTQHAAHKHGQQPPPPRKTAEEHQRQQPCLHTPTVCSGQSVSAQVWIYWIYLSTSWLYFYTALE